MNQRRPARRLAGLGAVLVLATVAACGDDDDASTDTTGAAAEAPGTTAGAPTTATAPAGADTTSGSETTAARETTAGSETTAATSDMGATGDALTPEDLAPQPLAETTDVSISVSGGVAAFLPILIANATGEFKKENLNVTLEVVPATEGTLLVSQGNLDAAAVAVNAGNFNLLAADPPMRFAFPYEPEYPAEAKGAGVWVNNSVTGDDGFQPDDLRGVPISSSTGFASAQLGYFYLNILNENGDFPITDLNAQQFANPDTPEALKNGALGAGIVFSPFQTIVEESGCCTYIDGSDPPFPLGWVLIGPKLYEENRDAGTALFRAMARTVVTYLQGDYINDPETGPLVAQVLEQPLDALQQQDQPVWDPSFPIDPEAAVSIQEYFKLLPGVLEYTEDLTVDDVFDLEMYDSVVGS